MKVPVFSAKYFDPSDKLFKELRIGGGDLTVTGLISSSSSIKEGAEEKSRTNLDRNTVVNQRAEEVGKSKGNPIVSILDEKIDGLLASLILRHSTLLTWFALIAFILGLISSLFNLSTFRRKILDFFNINKKTTAKEVNAFLVGLGGRNLTVKDIDHIVELILGSTSLFFEKRI